MCFFGNGARNKRENVRVFEVAQHADLVLQLTTLFSQIVGGASRVDPAHCFRATRVCFWVVVLPVWLVSFTNHLIRTAAVTVAAIAVAAAAAVTVPTFHRRRRRTQCLDGYVLPAKGGAENLAHAAITQKLEIFDFSGVDAATSKRALVHRELQHLWRRGPALKVKVFVFVVVGIGDSANSVARLDLDARLEIFIQVVATGAGQLLDALLHAVI